MARRSPVRFVAPLALIAVIAGGVVIVKQGLHHAPRVAPVKPSVAVKLPTRRGAPPAAATRPTNTYVVKAGDSLSTIAARAHVSLVELQRLNPGVDPGSLQPGRRLRLRR